MTIQSLDPPEQLPLRKEMLLAIKRTDVASACLNACDRFDQLFAINPLGQQFDFMAQLAAPTAIRFACELVGLPVLSPDTYFSLFLRLTRAMDKAVDSSRYGDGIEATEELNDLVTKAKTFAKPGSLIYELHAVPEVCVMLDTYVRNTISATFNAAFSTAYSSMGSFLKLAMERPGLAGQISGSADPSVGVQELLRFTSPAQSTRRYSTSDTVIGGQSIRENDPILTLIAAANRDPNVFTRPDDLELNRTPNPHLAFGSGPHFCVGAFPATEFLVEFIRRLAEVESELAAAGQPEWLDTFTFRCMRRLLVVRV